MLIRRGRLRLPSAKDPVNSMIRIEFIDGCYLVSVFDRVLNKQPTRIRKSRQLERKKI